MDKYRFKFSNFTEAESFKNMLIKASTPLLAPHIEGVFSVFESSYRPGNTRSLTPKQRHADEMYTEIEKEIDFLVEILNKVAPGSPVAMEVSDRIKVLELTLSKAKGN